MRMRSLSGRGQDAMLGTIIGGGIGLRFGGAPGAIAGASIGTSLLGGGSSTSAMAGAGAGALLGARFGPVGAVAGGTIGLIGSTPRSFEGESGTEYYNRQRAGGASVVGAYVSGMGEAIRRLIDSPLKRPTPGAGDGRREVTPFQADQMEAGGTAQQVQRNLIRATAGAGYEEDAGPLKPIVDLLIQVLDVLLKIQNPSYTPPPRSISEPSR
jgi:hypothetical protein